jgi:hypothetical protein
MVLFLYFVNAFALHLKGELTFQRANGEGRMEKSERFAPRKQLKTFAKVAIDD